ncbi:MAG: type II secretion system protein M [Endozoicomonadaceae bacterium]|nr:type II secretion system protein M [Endozoicomonadaceae bacterium]
MINKVKHSWQALDEKQQVYALVLCVVLAIWLLFVLAYLPIKMQNETFNTQLKVQTDIGQKLTNISQENVSFTSIGRRSVKSIVNKIAKQKGLRIDLKLDDNQLMLGVKNQSFDNLKDLLLSLRGQYAITTTKASITKTKDGFVNADLTLTLP